MKGKNKNWRKTLVKKLDDLVSKYVRLRDGKCVTCDSRERLTCGHFYSRVAYSTRWDLSNCHAQCWSCNFRHEFDPYNFNQYMLFKFGQGFIDTLHEKYVNPVKYKTFDLLELAVKMEAKLNKLKKEKGEI